MPQTAFLKNEVVVNFEGFCAAFWEQLRLLNFDVYWFKAKVNLF